MVFHHHSYSHMQEYLQTYKKNYGASEDIGLRKEAVQHKYGDKYDQFVNMGILKEKWHGDQCYATEHQVRYGEEHGTEEGSQLKNKRRQPPTTGSLCRKHCGH